MTRANLNFTYRQKGALKVLYHYQNGDQYPQGIRDYFNVLDLLKDFTPKGFKKWLGDNYTIQAPRAQGNLINNYADTEIPAKPRLQNHTTIGDLTDYTYVFNSNYEADYMSNTIQVYNWDKQIFDGSLEEFDKWIKAQK